MLFYETFSTRVDPRSVLVEQPSNSSIDLDDSFKGILQERCRKKEAVINYTPGTANKKDQNLSFQKTLGNRLLFEKTTSMDSNQSSWMNCGDDTFLNIEKMCETTFLENTLEATAVDRPLNDYEIVVTPVITPENELLKNLNDITQLYDIEAPSMLWNQTIFNADSTKGSPFKLVRSVL